MMTLIAAAALAAQQPAAPAPAAPMAEHEMHMKMAGQAGHKGMDCSKDCCRDMDARHDAHGSARPTPSGQ
jgi:hypothetical protein